MPTPSPRALVVSTALRPGNKTTTAARFLADRLTADGATVDEAALRKEGLVRGTIDGVKILARGELKKKVTITGAKFSEAAKRKIEAAGGTIS